MRPRLQEPFKRVRESLQRTKPLTMGWFASSLSAARPAANVKHDMNFARVFSGATRMVAFDRHNQYADILKANKGICYGLVHQWGLYHSSGRDFIRELYTADKKAERERLAFISTSQNTQYHYSGSYRIFPAVINGKAIRNTVKTVLSSPMQRLYQSHLGVLNLHPEKNSPHGGHVIGLKATVGPNNSFRLTCFDPNFGEATFINKQSAYRGLARLIDE